MIRICIILEVLDLLADNMAFPLEYFILPRKIRREKRYQYSLADLQQSLHNFAGFRVYSSIGICFSCSVPSLILAK